METYITRAGQELTLPAVRAGSARKTKNDLYKLWSYLLEKAIVEARLWGNSNMEFMFERMNPKTMTQAERDVVNNFLGI